MSEELTRAELRKHPVYGLLNDQAAQGGLPSMGELDALKLPSLDRRRVATAAAEIVAVRASGENAEATRKAREAAERIVKGLDPEFQRPDYRGEPEMDPKQLADQVPRW